MLAGLGWLAASAAARACCAVVAAAASSAEGVLLVATARRASASFTAAASSSDDCLRLPLAALQTLLATLGSSRHLYVHIDLLLPTVQSQLLRQHVFPAIPSTLNLLQAAVNPADSR